VLPLEIAPEEVSRKLKAGETLHLIDVREPDELRICRIEGAEAVPLRTVPQALEGLRDKARTGTVILFCHHGMRSLQATSWLRKQGLAACQSMQGGIELWSTAVDPSVPRY
jgi:rhodanese-related sulfurtransferase